MHRAWRLLKTTLRAPNTDAPRPHTHQDQLNRVLHRSDNSRVAHTLWVAHIVQAMLQPYVIYNCGSTNDASLFFLTTSAQSATTTNGSLCGAPALPAMRPRAASLVGPLARDVPYSKISVDHRPACDAHRSQKTIRAHHFLAMVVDMAA